jgi:hypothetical protein
MLNSIQNAGLHDMLRLNAASLGSAHKVGLPIRPTNGFVSLKNVYGYTSPDPEKGYTISKLKVLDSLVESLRLHRRESLELNPEDSFPENVDQTIGKLMVQLEETLSSTNDPYGHFFPPAQGQVINLLA